MEQEELQNQFVVFFGQNSVQLCLDVGKCTTYVEKEQKEVGKMKLLKSAYSAFRAQLSCVQLSALCRKGFALGMAFYCRSSY